MTGEKEDKSYSFVKPGVLQSRIMNRQRQSALGRGLGSLLSTMGPGTRELEESQTQSPLPTLEIVDQEPAETVDDPRPEGVRRSALLSRIQGLHRSESAQGLDALFRAVSKANEPSASNTTTEAPSYSFQEAPPAQSYPPGDVASAPAAPLQGSDIAMVSVGNRQLPLSRDFTVVMMNVSLIQPNPFVPLSRIDREGLERLRESIKAHGFLRPLVVMPSTLGSLSGGDTYWLIAGERSWQIARLLGMETVPVRVSDVSPREAIQMILAEDWHIQRLPAMDRARLCMVLIEQMGMTVEEVAERLAVDMAEIEGTLSYLRLEIDLQDRLNNGQISEPVARSLAGIEDPELREDITAYTLRYKWTPGRIERAIKARRERDP